MQIENFSTSSLSQIIPSYLYEQYSDDADLQGFVEAYNNITQGYLDWFNSTPLGLYTSSNITGSLLDWIGQGVYGFTRPVIVTGGVSASVSDDIYKRCLTWITYLGDGRQMSVQWIKRRVARFIYGANGADVDIANIANVGITFNGRIPQGEYDTVPFDVVAFDDQNFVNSHKVIITVPSTASGSSALQLLIEQQSLALPFQLSYSVALV